MLHYCAALSKGRLANMIVTMHNTFFCSVKMLFTAFFLCQSRFAYAEIHGIITGTTNYVYRMYSKSNNEPAIQANLDYQHSSGLFTGASASSFNIGNSEVFEEGVFPNAARIEVTPYLGWSYNFADDWRVDMQYSRYFYDGLLYGLEADYNEFYLFLHYKDLVSAQASFTDDFYGIGNAASFYELTGRYPLTDFLEVSATLGYGQLSKVLLADYPYWNVGLTGRYKFVALDLRYYDAREQFFGDEFDQFLLPDHPETLKPTVVFSLSVGF